MEAMWDLGINIILWLQGLGDWLAAPMKFFSFLGNEEFFLIIMPVFFWCISTAIGFRLGMLLLLSSSINGIFKLLFHGPRPYWYSTQVRAWVAETSFGLPSGHAMSAASVWGGLAASLRQRWAWIGAITLIFLIGLSRMYTGVHFPSDVLLGWILGGLLLYAYLKLEPAAREWVAKQSVLARLGWGFGLSMLLIVLGFLARSLLSGWTMPEIWSTNALLAEADEPIAPLGMNGIVSNSGVLFGMIAGWLLMQRSGGFDPGGLLWKRAARFLVGMVGVLLFWRGLGMVLPGGEDVVGYFFRYFRYLLIGLWIAGFAPILFVRVGLANKAPAATSKRRRVRAAAAH